MRYVEISGSLAFPEGECAGCSGEAGVSLRRSRLAKTEVGALPIFSKVLVASKESRLELQVPSCDSCAPTLPRLRPTGAQYVVVWGGLALLFLLAFVPLAGSLPDTPVFFCGGPALLATLVTLAWYGTRRPPGNAASYYQPIFLRAASRESLILGFANERYAGLFVDANPGSRIGSKVRQRRLVVD